MGGIVQVLIKKDRDGNIVAEPFLNVLGRWLFKIGSGSTFVEYVKPRKKNKYHQKRNLNKA